MSEQAQRKIVQPATVGEAEPAGWGLALLPNSRQRVQATFGLLCVLFILMLGFGAYLAVAAGPRAQPSGYGESEERQAPGVPPHKRPAAIISGALLGLLASAVAYAAGRGRSTSRAVRFALAAQPLACLGIGVMTMPGSRLVHFSWAGFLIVAFPFMVPASRRALLSSSIASAASIPIGVVASRAVFANRSVPSEILIEFSLTSTLFVVLAVLSHRLMRNMTDASREATGYRLADEPLGEGGMGVVYKAYRPMVKAPVAVKFIRREHLLLKAPDLVYEGQARFWREAELAARLQSPHTVRVYDLGVSPEGELYCVMEYLEGSSFDERIGARLALSQIVGWIRQICGSLHEAHEMGLVHRDIKPANLMLCNYAGEKEFVKVLDFGLGLLVHEDPFRNVVRDPPPGSRLWTAPEFWRGEAVDRRADLYSLGCVMFALVAGEPPFNGKAAHLAPERPDLRDHRDDVPEGLAELIAECIARDVPKRPGSAREIQERLTAVA